jgi:hypothetical protein
VHLYQPLDLAPTGQTDASGKTIFGFPITQGVASTTYHDNLNSRWDWFVRGDVNHTGRIYEDEINQAWIGAAWKFNAHAGVEDKTVRFEIYCNNITNDKHWLSGVRGTQSNYTLTPGTVSQDTASVVLPRLRVFGMRVSAKFD